MPSVTGYVSAKEWLAEAREALEHAVECLGQIRSVIDDVRTDMAAAPVPRGYTGYRASIGEGQKFHDLEDAEDHITRLTVILRDLDLDAFNIYCIKDWESWRAEAVTAYARKHGL